MYPSVIESIRRLCTEYPVMSILTELLAVAQVKAACIEQTTQVRVRNKQ